MTETGSEFAYGSLFSAAVPAAAARFAGLPKYNFGTGHNDPEVIPTEALAEAAAAVIRRHGDRLAIYNLGQGSLGFEGLRRFLADKLKRVRGIACTPDDILVTTGSLQGIDLVNQLMLERGDTVLVEEFSYSAAISKLRGLGVEIVGVPLDGGGLRVDAMEEILVRLKERGVRPKYLYTIPTVQNPTGTILSLERRHQLLRLTRAFGVPVFEDECYADVLWRHDAPQALYGIDPSQVIHIGSLSKSLAPALRIGYVVAPWNVLGRMVAMKSDGGTGALDQMVAAEYFGSRFDEHVRKLSAAVEAKLDALMEAIQAQFGTSAEVRRPEGGLFVWVRLPEQVDTRRLAPAAAAAGIAFNPGPELSCEPETGRNWMRLCFALPSEQQIRDGVAELARVCFEQTGIPQRSGNVAR
ncbi:MAG TPA: PLP-dependent aminotransferase family protein [Geminicoccaceae bacterium]|nr:PLP-dependent aminotransferase family protein [Geminicoccus sp.]HMU51841.1 PLP-dependent aminotransferase family protein [Geminicoccaceae bacterium]